MKASSSRIRLSFGDKIYFFFAYLLIGLVLLATLYPLYFVLIASFSDPYAVAAGDVILWPKDISLAAYERIFDYNLVWISYGNSLYYTLFGTLINVAMTIIAAFVLSRRNLIGNTLFTWIILFTMYFSGGVIPSYLNLRSLKLLNTVWAIVLPGAISTYNLLVARTFMNHSIPYEL